MGIRVGTRSQALAVTVDLVLSRLKYPKYMWSGPVSLILVQVVPKELKIP